MKPVSYFKGFRPCSLGLNSSFECESILSPVSDLTKNLDDASLSETPRRRSAHTSPLHDRQLFSPDAGFGSPSVELPRRDRSDSAQKGNRRPSAFRPFRSFSSSFDAPSKISTPTQRDTNTCGSFNTSSTNIDVHNAGGVSSCLPVRKLFSTPNSNKLQRCSSMPRPSSAQRLESRFQDDNACTGLDDKENIFPCSPTSRLFIPVRDGDDSSRSQDSGLSVGADSTSNSLPASTAKFQFATPSGRPPRRSSRLSASSSCNSSQRSSPLTIGSANQAAGNLDLLPGAFPDDIAKCVSRWHRSPSITAELQQCNSSFHDSPNVAHIVRPTSVPVINQSLRTRRDSTNSLEPVRQGSIGCDSSNSWGSNEDDVHDQISSQLFFDSLSESPQSDQTLVAHLSSCNPDESGNSACDTSIKLVRPRLLLQPKRVFRSKSLAPSDVSPQKELLNSPELCSRISASAGGVRPQIRISQRRLSEKRQSSHALDDDALTSTPCQKKSRTLDNSAPASTPDSTKRSARSRRGSRAILPAKSLSPSASMPSFPINGECMFGNHELATKRLNDTEHVLTGDGRHNACLPTVASPKEGVTAVSCETLNNVLKGLYNHLIETYIIVDSRYPYEYNGGHIKSAINWHRDDQMLSALMTEPHVARDPNKRVVIFFHCEFSSERGPRMCRNLRSDDRKRNIANYPYLHYPEVYLIAGGYKEFYSTFPESCNGGYTTMHDKQFRCDLSKHEREARSFKLKSKSAIFSAN